MTSRAHVQVKDDENPIRQEMLLTRVSRVLVPVLLAVVICPHLSLARPKPRCWSTLSSQRSIAPFSPCFEDKCRCSEDTLDCSSNYGNLSYVPRDQGERELLNFSNNALGKIDNPVFFINASSNTSIVDLYNNDLTRIHPGAFRSMYKLEKVLIGGNKLPYTDLKAVLYAPRLRSMEVKCGGLDDVPYDFFVNRSCSRLRYVDLSWNHLKVLDMKVFQPLARLETMILRFNKIETVHSAYHPSLMVLVLHKNKLFDFPTTCNANGESLYPNLTQLDLNFNYISDIPDHVCLPRLTALKLKYNTFQIFTRNMFTLPRFPMLVNLSLTEMRVKIEKMEDFAFNSSKLTVLELGLNNVNFSSEHTVHHDVFRGCDSLAKLYLDGKNNFKAVSFERFEKLFSHLATLRVLYLGKTGLSVKRETFEMLPNLVELYLYENSMRTIPEGSFDHLVNLTVLKLGGNQISTVPSSVFSDDTRRRLQKIDLSGNPFDCSCHIVEFQQWMRSTPEKFLDFGQGYRCWNVNNTSVLDFSIAEQACVFDYSTNILIIGVCLVLILLLLRAMLAYSWRWRIRLWLHDFRWGHNGMAGHMRPRAYPYQYDIFVAYDDEERVDRHWVHNTLLPMLEAEKWKVFIQARDLTLGRPDASILDYVDKSRSTIAVFSSSFAMSGMCQWILSLSLDQLLNYRCPMVAVILPGLQPRDVTPGMRRALKTITYVDWYEGDKGKEFIRGVIQEALRDLFKKEN